MFWLASNEGLILNGSSVHAGLRTRLSGDDFADYEDDNRQGFLRISADDIDELRPQGVVDKIMERIGIEVPVYLSIDIDVLDPGVAPGTGTPEPGGWTMRELIRILRGIERLNVVGAVSFIQLSFPYHTSRGSKKPVQTNLISFWTRFWITGYPISASSCLMASRLFS